MSRSAPGGAAAAHYAIAGGGLCGRLLAWRLALAGHRVTLADRGHADMREDARPAAAHVAAAMLAPLAESAISEPMLTRLGAASLPLWTQWIAELNRHAAKPVFLQRAGSLILWHRQDRDEAQRFAQRLDPTAAGSATERVDAARIAELEPQLGARFAQGLYLPGEGQLDNRGLLDALAAELRRLGVDLRWGEETDPDTLRKRCGADWGVDCRGLGAKPDMPALRGVRGEVIRVHSEEIRLHRPVRLIHPRYPIYIAPKPEGVFVIGATELESEDDGPATVRSALELLSAAHSLHPAFGEARILEIAANRRPALPDNLPRVEQAGAGLLRINGLYRHGFMIAPAVVENALGMLDALRKDAASLAPGAAIAH
ncbi:MAG: glycine oxidase ThiO [Candidatus Protistobacter heckmanni]|nr:glycine oxidase ThiO [Candidatus Protistobacter heckmanni]